MDGIRATPMQYPILGLLADRLKRAQQFAVAPGGYVNPPAEVLLNLLGVPAIQQTMERMAYGEPLTTGRGMTTQIRPEVAEAAMTLLPAAAGTARVAERGAMAAGRAGERMAERVVPQIMERGGMPASLLEGMSSRTVSPLTVYHGSPAKFERFDPTKIGSGEGAQAYGYGHYVAESPNVAKEYREVLSGSGKKLVNATFSNDPELWVAGQLYSKISKPDIVEGLDILGYKGNVDDIINSAQKRLKSELGAGSLYKIDLPDEQIARMLDWDKPLSKQKDVMAALNSIAEKNVKAKVRNDIENEIRASGVLPVDKTGDDYMSLLFGQSDETIAKADQMLKQLADEQMAKIDFAPLIKNELEGMKPATMTWDATGKEFYEMLAQRSGSPEKASALFKEQGIPGIRYLDQGSRGTGQGTSNFVVFPGNEDLLSILERNNQPVGLLSKPKAVESAPAQSLLDYRGSHTAPGPDFGAPLHDLTGGGQMYPPDVYSPKAAQYYGGGVPYDQKAFDIAQSFKDKPNAMVTIYRAVPKEMSNSEKLAALEKEMAAYMKRGTLPKDAENYSSGSKWYDWAYDEREKLRNLPDEPSNKMNINAGDWVTLTKEYAKDHGESALKGQYKILSKKVRAKDLWTNADSIHEFGYHPQ